MTTLSADDVSQLYRECVVEVEGRLAYVRDILIRDGEPHRLAVRFLGDARNTTVVADPDVVLSPTAPYRLGYVQHDPTQAFYLSRRPRRQYRVGWCESVISNFTPTAWLDVATGVRVVNNLKGVFPSYEEALEIVRKGEARSVAFDHQFAIADKGGILEYKGRGIARVGKDGVPDFASQGLNHLVELFKKSV